MTLETILGFFFFFVVLLFEEKSSCSGFPVLQSEILRLLNPLSKVPFRIMGKWLEST